MPPHRARHKIFGRIIFLITRTILLPTLGPLRFSSIAASIKTMLLVSDSSSSTERITKMVVVVVVKQKNKGGYYTDKLYTSNSKSQKYIIIHINKYII